MINVKAIEILITVKNLKIIEFFCECGFKNVCLISFKETHFII